MSSFTHILAGVVGGVIGFFVGGGPMGAWIGFGIGLGLATIIDPMVPDMPTPGEPMGEVEIMSNTEGIPIPDLLGTSKMTGNLLYYGNNRRVEVTEEQDTGGSGGGSQTVVTGYKYYLTWAMGFCLGPVDTLYTIYFDDDIVWAGAVPRSEAINGKVTIGLYEGGDYGDYIEECVDEYGVVDYDCLSALYGELGKLKVSENYIGLMHFYFGTSDQALDTTLTSLMVEEGAIPDSTWAVPYRRQCYAVMNDCFIGDYNRCPTVKVVIRKAPECSFDT